MKLILQSRGHIHGVHKNTSAVNNNRMRNLPSPVVTIHIFEAINPLPGSYLGRIMLTPPGSALLYYINFLWIQFYAGVLQ